MQDLDSDPPPIAMDGLVDGGHAPDAEQAADLPLIAKDPPSPLWLEREQFIVSRQGRSTRVHLHGLLATAGFRNASTVFA
jgi:hypothetical protein